MIVTDLSNISVRFRVGILPQTFWVGTVIHSTHIIYRAWTPRHRLFILAICDYTSATFEAEANIQLTNLL